MSSKPKRNHFGRTLIITATAIGVTIGAAGLAGAAQSVLSSNSFSSDVALEAEVTTPTSDDQATDDTTAGSTDDTTADSTEDSTENSTDDSTENTTGNSTDDSTDNTTDDSSGPSSSNPGLPLPAPFTKTYVSGGGSITVVWTGTAFVLASVDATAGYTAEIEDQRWDRIRVDFEGAADSRIEVRISDDDNSVRVRID